MTKTKNIHAASNATIAKVMAEQAPATEAKSKNAPGVLKRSNAYFIDPTKIMRKPGHNPRFDFGDIERLAHQIKVQKAIDGHGLLNDIRVKRIAPTILDDGKGPTGSQEFIFELVDGDRRLTAIELLIKKGEVFEMGVPAKLDDKDQTEVAGLVKMYIANEGKAFLPLEEAAAYKKFREAGMTIKQICEVTGRKQVHVTEVLNLIKADDSVLAAVADGSIGKTMAKKIAKVAKGDNAKQKELVASAKAIGKDSAKRRAVIKEVEKTRAAGAAKKGKVLKIRALSDGELSDIGAKIANTLLDRVVEAGLTPNADLREWVGKDKELLLAYTFGALEALKVAAGAPDKLVE